MSKKPYDCEGSLLAATRKLLAGRSESYLEIYAGTKLNPSWLDKLCRGLIRNPSVNRVQFLYEYLTAQKLRHR